jgi:hypothetical protein
MNGSYVVVLESQKKIDYYRKTCGQYCGEMDNMSFMLIYIRNNDELHFSQGGI